MKIDDTHYRCPRCKRVLPIGDFGSNRSRHRGKNEYCHQCHNQNTKASKYRKAIAAHAAEGAAAREARRALEDRRLLREIEDSGL